MRWISNGRILKAFAAGAVASLMLLPSFCAATPAQPSPLTVYTVNYPLAYFAARIGGEHVRVEFPAPSAGDPAAWIPGAQDLVAYRSADLVLLNGAGYAAWVAGASLSADRLVNTSAAFADRLIVEGGGAHSHGGEAHSHEATTAFTTWLDPQLAIAQAAAVRDALVAQLPAATMDFDAGFDALRIDLAALDREFAALFAKLGNTAVVFSHPVYQYLQRRYALNAISVHWEPGEVPGEEAMAELAEQLVRHPARIMIWEGAPLPESTAALAEWSIGSAVFDPCGNRPEEGDYLSVMRQNAANLEALLK